MLLPHMDSLELKAMETLLSRKKFKIGEKIQISCEKVQLMLVPVEQHSPLPTVGCALPSKEGNMEGRYRGNT